MTRAKELQLDDGPRSSLSIGPGFRQYSGISPKFARRFAEGIEKLAARSPEEDQMTCLSSECTVAAQAFGRLTRPVWAVEPPWCRLQEDGQRCDDHCGGGQQWYGATDGYYHVQFVVGRDQDSWQRTIVAGCDVNRLQRKIVAGSFLPQGSLLAVTKEDGSERSLLAVLGRQQIDGSAAWWATIDDGDVKSNYENCLEDGGGRDSYRVAGM
ncbi:hypothetical protein BHE74_00017598 [Ensete ventricosum]|nr:hypothetical protein BHE74_00017598 [Ensete ventricosum]